MPLRVGAADDSAPSLSATPASRTDPPLLTQPLVHAARPSRLVLITLPATGERPLRVTVAGLPPGLLLDEATGRISGSTTATGTHRLDITG